MTLTTNQPTTGAAKTMAADDKGFWDLIGAVLPGLAGQAGQALGIDPRVAGQTVSQVLNLFGIGGQGKAFTAVMPKDQAISQLQQVVSPHLSDPAFATALGKWLQAAVEPVQAHKEGKDYKPSVDLTKNWFTDVVSDIGDTLGSVNWGQVAQVGMQALPFVLSVL